MSEMQIRTFGQTAAAVTVTREQIVATMKLITKVHRNRGEAEYLCPYFHAKAITISVEQGAAETRLHNRAARLSTGGRLRRARIALAIG